MGPYLSYKLALCSGFLPVMENLENDPALWKTWKTHGI